MTVTWHVDDLKISHMESDEVTKCIEHFKKIYRNRMTVRRGKVHDYLRMDLDFSSPKVLKIGTIKYIKKVIEEFPEEIKSVAPEEIKSVAATPAKHMTYSSRPEAAQQQRQDIMVPTMPLRKMMTASIPSKPA